MATEATYAFKKAVRGLLASNASVTALVPASSILDRHGRPEVFPCLILGEGQRVRDNSVIERNRVTVFLDLHAWSKESGFNEVNQIAGEVWDALRGSSLSVDGHTLYDLQDEGTRFLRDPGGEHSHAVLTVSGHMEES